MKNNRLISLSITSLVALSLSVNCFAFNAPFTDIEDISTKDKIIALYEKGYIVGVSEGKFEPSRGITAAEGIRMIVSTFGLNIDNIRFIKEPKATDYFIKANNDAWYANTLIIASINGLDLSADLNPDLELTKEEFIYQLVTALEKAYTLPMINLSPVDISDDGEINIVYSGAIQRSLYYNIVKLDYDGFFNPKLKITRAEAAEYLYNSIKYMETHNAKNQTN